MWTARRPASSLTATPSKQTFGFFNRNLVMEYSHADAVADGVNVDYDVYRIRTRITEQGSTVEAGHYLDRRDRNTRAIRWERMDEDFTYGPDSLDRAVVAKDQIRTIIRTFKEKLFTEIFPGRTEVPKIRRNITISMGLISVPVAIMSTVTAIRGW